MIAIMFENLIEKLIARASKPRNLVAETNLFHQDDPVLAMFVIKEGSIDLVRNQLDGTPIILQRASNLSILAEASLYSEVYHCDAIIRSPSIVYEFSKPDFLALLKQDEDLSNSWAASLSREVQNGRKRIEILTRKTVADRLDGWMAWHENELPSKGQWKDIATYIGVSPEALYRELAKRRSK